MFKPTTRKSYGFSTHPIIYVGKQKIMSNIFNENLQSITEIYSWVNAEVPFTANLFSNWKWGIFVAITLKLF